MIVMSDTAAVLRARALADASWDRSRGWWIERSVREQLLLGVLAATAIIALLLAAVIVPLQSSRAAALANIRAAGLIEARLKAGGLGTARNQPMRSGTASAILTDSTAAAGLTIQRIEPEGGDTRVVLNDAPFAVVLQWLADVEATSRLRIVGADIQAARSDHRGSPGFVSAALVIHG